MSDQRAANVAAQTARPTPPGLIGLPADVRARALEYPGDMAAFSAFVELVNRFDRFENFPTARELEVQWRPTGTFKPARDCLVLEDDRGWAAMISVDPHVREGKLVFLVEGWVRPDRRREGIGRALLAWSERHAADLAEEGAVPALPAFVHFTILESNPAAIAFARSTGYPMFRHGFLMRRDLSTPIPDRRLPPGIEIRPVEPEHHRRIWDADVEAFLDHHEPRERDEGDFEAAFHGPDVDTSLWRVAWEGDEVVGSVMNAIFAEENARLGLDIGWLEHVSVRRAWRGRGVASALIVESLRALRERGMQIATLGVDGLNLTGALALYERLGFYRHETWVAYRQPLEAVAPARPA